MDDTIRHAIASWGFLLPRNSRMTLAEFAALIRAYSDHPRAQILAAADGPHLGKRVPPDALPADVRRAIDLDLEDGE